MVPGCLRWLVRGVSVAVYHLDDFLKKLLSIVIDSIWEFSEHGARVRKLVFRRNLQHL